MIIQSPSFSLMAANISVNANSESDTKLSQFMAKQITFDDLWGSPEVKRMVDTILSTCFKPKMGSAITIKEKGLGFTVQMDTPYSSNLVFALLLPVGSDRRSIGKGSVEVTTNKGKHSKLNVTVVKQGVLLECPLTYTLKSLCAIRYYDMVAESPNVTAQGRVDAERAKKRAEEEFDAFRNDEPSVCLMGEQAIAPMLDGCVYFHGPVIPVYNGITDSIPFLGAPQELIDAVNDYRMRSIDYFKNLNAIAGGLTAIEAELDKLGVGSHLKAGDWYVLTSRINHTMSVTPEIVSFIKDNVKYAGGLAMHYLNSNFKNQTFNSGMMAAAVRGFFAKLGRLQGKNEFEADSQTFSPTEVVTAIMHQGGKFTSAEIKEVAMHLEALMYTQRGLINVSLGLPKDATRDDVTFYKRFVSIASKGRSSWPVSVSQRVVMSADKSHFVVTYPSGGKGEMYAESSPQERVPHLVSFVIPALDSVSEALAHGAKAYMTIELLLNSLRDPDVKLEDVFNEQDGTITIWALHNLLNEMFHYGIVSPDPLIVIPGGKI